MSTSADLIVESPSVKREMRRLRRLHGVLAKALDLAAQDAGVSAESYLRRAVLALEAGA